MPVHIRRRHETPPVAKSESVKERLNLLLDSDLKRWAQGYADRNGVTLTGLLTSFLEHVRAQEEGISPRPLHLDHGLVAWADRYAKNRMTSLDQLVTSFLFSLMDREKGLEVEQV